MAKNKPEKPEIVEAEVVETKSAQNAQPAGSGWGGKLIWGVFFITIGVALLLANLGVVSVDMSGLWSLWPLFIVAIGLSILSLRGWLAGLVYGLAAVLMIGVTWLALTGTLPISSTGETTKDISVVSQSQDVSRLEAIVSAGASRLEISGGASSSLIAGSLTSNQSTLKQDISTRDEVQRVVLSLESDWQRMFGSGFNNDLRVKLTDSLPVDLKVDAGASSIKADLSTILLESLEVDSGASSIDIKLGDRSDKVKVDIDTGVSSIKLAVPSSVGVELVIDDGLSSKSIPDGFKEIDESTYRSSNFDEADKRITIMVDIGVSSFKLDTY